MGVTTVLTFKNKQHLKRQYTDFTHEHQYDSFIVYALDLKELPKY